MNNIIKTCNDYNSICTIKEWNNNLGNIILEDIKHPMENNID